MPDTSQRRTIAVIDGNSLMHRAYHAIMQPMTAPDGTHTNALFGFFNMFLKLVDTYKPDGIICAFDKGKPKIRMDMYADYKAQRPPMDPELHEQFPVVKDLLGALEVPVCELEGWEGDDILGTLAARGEAAGYDMLLVTGDRDMYQLATEHVHIVSTKKGVSEVAIMTPESVDDLYHGITPELVPDFYGLKGDSSDNIPGVPGIGPKKAAALIVEYGSLDEVIAHAQEIPGKMGENLRENIDNARLSRELATIRTDAPLEFSFDDARFPTFDPQTVMRAFSAFGFTGITRRLASLVGAPSFADDTGAAVVSVPDTILEADEALEWLRTQLTSEAYFGCAVGSGEQSAGSLALDFGDTNTQQLWVSSADALLHLSGKHAHEALKLLLTQAYVASCDLKALVHELIPVDSSREVEIDPRELKTDNLFDVTVAAYLLNSDQANYEPAELLVQYKAARLPDPSENFPQEAYEALAARLLVEPLEKALEADGAQVLFRDIEMPLLGVLARIERHGLALDSSILAQQSQELGEEMSRMVEDIYEQAGERFNVDSPMQLSHILFDVMGLPTKGLKKTQRGYYSTNAKILQDLAKQHHIVAEVLEYRERAKIKGTYLDALPALVKKDGRIHTTFNQAIAATGRLSSSDPNLQNIPTRSELGHRVRTAFSMPAGHLFLACDYSQIELRLLAHLSQDEHLIAAFNEGADFHAATAARVFGVALNEVTPELRSRAKAVNFGIVYGQQAHGLSEELKIAHYEAQEMIDRYFEAYPGVRAFLDGQIKLARTQGYVSTMYGRKRYTKDINASNFQMRSFAERTAMNHPMQGSAADIIKIAMIRVQEAMDKAGFTARMVLQIHDELDFEVPKEELEDLATLVKSIMEAVVELSVPLIADASWGETWADAK